MEIPEQQLYNELIEALRLRKTNELIAQEIKTNLHSCEVTRREIIADLEKMNARADIMMRDGSTRSERSELADEIKEQKKLFKEIEDKIKALSKKMPALPLDQKEVYDKIVNEYPELLN